MRLRTWRRPGSGRALQRSTRAAAGAARQRREGERRDESWREHFLFGCLLVVARDERSDATRDEADGQRAARVRHDGRDEPTGANGLELRIELARQLVAIRVVQIIAVDAEAHAR